MAGFRLPRQRNRPLILTLVTTAFLYLYLSTDLLSAPTFDTSYSSLQKASKTNKIQFNFKAQGVSAGDPPKAQAVVNVMKRTLWGYRLKSWGKDEIMPITGQSKNTRNGWASTIVDTLTTTALMGLEEEFAMQLDYTININFASAEGLVDPFETIIRYLGAIVATVDMIDQGIVRKTLIKPGQRDALLEKAVQLADLLGPAFDSPTGMLWPRINFTSSEGFPFPYYGYAHLPVTDPARSGTNFLEYKVLSKLTGDLRYVTNATRAWEPLVWNRTAEEMPGLVDSPIDILTGALLDKHRSWGAGHDSYYEYLIKAYILSPQGHHASIYRDRWTQAVESTMKHLIVKGVPFQGDKSGKIFLSEWRSGSLRNEMGHLTCFAGGNFVLGGKILDRPDIIKLGLDIVDTCHHTYISTTTGIGPEVFSWVPEKVGRVGANYEPRAVDQQRQLENTGFWISDARYQLRPETMESYFYAYRITGNPVYQQWAWDAFNSIINATEVEFGYAEVIDVSYPPGPSNHNDMTESFWGAETLKYLYLIFADEEVGNLDKWVFSTEAHPLKIIA